MKQMTTGTTPVPKRILDSLNGADDVNRQMTIDVLTDIYKTELKELVASEDKNTKLAVKFCDGLPILEAVQAIKACKKVLDMGFMLPDYATSKHTYEDKTLKKHKTWMQYYQQEKWDASKLDYSKKYIVINEDYVAEGGCGVVSYRCVKEKWHNQGNCFLHELGHHIGFTFWPYRTATMHGQARATIRKGSKKWLYIKEHVSEYGASSQHEFVAELMSGILAGNKFPKGVFDLLDKCEDERFKKLVKIGME